MTQQTAHMVNGVNVNQLVKTIETMQEQPDLARCQFRAQSEWINGAHTQTKIQGFYAAGQEDNSRANPFHLIGDEPPILLGENQAPNAVETMLHALASCLTVGFVYNAAAQGIDIESLTFEMEGDLDLHAFLGLSGKPRPGYEHINVTYRVDSNAPREKILELCDYVQKTSPVLDNLRNPTRVTVTLES